MPKIILTVGISASGKTTWAEEWVRDNSGWEEINRDNKRFEHFCNGVRDWNLYKFTKEREKEVTRICYDHWQYCAYHKLNVVVSDTNLNPKTQAMWKQRADAVGYEFEIKYFDISLEEAWKRNERRPNPVRRDVITEQWPKWLEITGRRRYTPSSVRQKIIVSDVDGTVAKKGDRSPYDWQKVGLDIPRKEIITLIESLCKSQNYKLIFVSGRDGSCREETWQWLEKHIPISFSLYMREQGDSRKDTIIKEEILWNNLEPWYAIDYWFDDRPCIIRMLKDIGVNVIDVSEGYCEF